MKALYKGLVYTVKGTTCDEAILIDPYRGQEIRVPLGAPDLILEPTDGDLAEIAEDEPVGPPTLSKLADDVRFWLLCLADEDDIRQFAAEWYGVPMDDVTYDPKTDTITFRSKPNETP